MENLDLSRMDVRQILSICFGIATDDMQGDSIKEVFESLRTNGSKHIVDGLLTIFDRYAEEQANSLKGEVLNSSRKVYEALRLYFIGKKQEEFHIIMLDNKYRVIDEPILITKGILNRSLVHPREVFAPAVEARAAAVMLIHCHPSGDPQPSTQDVEITKRLRESGEIVGINVVDHIVFGSNSFFSFIDEDLM